MSDEFEPEIVPAVDGEITSSTSVPRIHSTNEEKIAYVLLKYCPKLSAKDAQEQALNIDILWSTLRGQLDVDKSNIRPEVEKKSLQTAAKAIKSNSKKIRSLGFHGSQALSKAIQSASLQMNHGAHQNEIWPDHLGSEDLADELERIASILVAAEASIEIMCAPVQGGLHKKHDENGFKVGNATKPHLHEFSVFCTMLFWKHSGSKVTVNTPSTQIGHPSYSPYLDFLTEIFAATGVPDSDSALSQAKEMVKLKKKEGIFC